MESLLETDLRASLLAIRALILAMLLSMHASIGYAQQASRYLSRDEEEPIAEQVTDPLAHLTQIQIKDIYTPAEYGTNAQLNTIELRAVLAIHPLSFIPVEQLVRPTIRVVTIPNGEGASTATTYDDMQLFDLFQMPLPHTQEIGFRWGLGPYFVFPTSASDRVGKGLLADGTGLGVFISRDSASQYCGTFSTTYIVRVHFVEVEVFCLADVPTDSQLSARGWMVPEIERCDLDHRLAPQVLDHDPTERGNRPGLEALSGLRGRYFAWSPGKCLSTIRRSDRPIHDRFLGQAVVPRLRKRGQVRGACGLEYASDAIGGLPKAPDFWVLRNSLVAAVYAASSSSSAHYSIRGPKKE